MKTMLSNPKFLVEDYKTEDLFDFTTYADDLQRKIEGLPNKSLLGIVGNYGMGKSTLLEKTRSKLADENTIWVHFDAWKYPERNNLWEGFVLDFVRQVAEKDFNKILQVMDGTSGEAKKKLAKLAGSVINIGVAGSGAIIGKLADFFVTSPAKRVFQIQRVFSEVLEKKEVKNKQIYIVIEDADRSGKAGIYFIETLSHFLRDPELIQKIKVFVPIAGKSFTQEQESYIKALDFVEFFNINSRDCTKFVETIFSTDLVSNSMAKNHLVEYLQRLIYNEKLSFRDLKFIIRNAESKYQLLQAKSYNPDPRIVLIIESLRYIKDVNSANDESRHQTLMKNNFFIKGEDSHLLILSIGQSQEVAKIVEIINDPEVNARDSIFINSISFVENHARFNSGRPLQNGNKYILPDYYLE